MGAQILDVLDRAKVHVRVAMWANLPEYGDWRLVLAGRAFDKLGDFDAYGLIHETLSAAGIRPSMTPILMIFPMKDPFIVALRKTVGKTESRDGMRISGYPIGDRYPVDGFVYRIK